MGEHIHLGAKDLKNKKLGFTKPKILTRTSRDTLPLRDFSDSFQCMMYSSWTLISNISGFSFFCSGECTGPFWVDHVSWLDPFQCMLHYPTFLSAWCFWSGPFQCTLLDLILFCTGGFWIPYVLLLNWTLISGRCFWIGSFSVHVFYRTFIELRTFLDWTPLVKVWD